VKAQDAQVAALQAQADIFEDERRTRDEVKAKEIFISHLNGLSGLIDEEAKRERRPPSPCKVSVFVERSENEKVRYYLPRNAISIRMILDSKSRKVSCSRKGCELIYQKLSEVEKLKVR